MAITAAGYTNGDDCFLAWSMPNTKDCRGFAISRQRTRPDGSVEVTVLPNFVGFDSQPAKPHQQRPSTEWPLQRYTWTDHAVDEADVVEYSIAPIMAQGDQLVPSLDETVKVGPLTATSRGGTLPASDGTTGQSFAYFNRGVLLSQYVAKQLPVGFTKKDITALIGTLSGEASDLRAFLTGQLGSRLISILDAADADGTEIYAALYELNDDALIRRLIRFGTRAHVLLSNGSDRTGDGNAAAAGRLEGVVDLQRRMLGNEGLGHNKFLVLVKQGQPMAVWTGSTNWATTGLCTQANNAILVEDHDVAGEYLAQWKLLAADVPVDVNGKPRHFGSALMNANDTSKPVGATGHLWFTRTSDGREMAEVSEIINGAKHAILFLMFEPGSSGLLQVIQARLSPAAATYDPALYVHGVVNTVQATTGTVDVTTVGDGKARPFSLKVVQPEGVSDGLAGWAKEVLRAEFLKTSGGVVGFAIVHSKVIVVDPFTGPVVITGSHNFSQNASGKNDENLLVLRGDQALAERYAVNVMGVYQHYRWRAYLVECAKRGVSPWKGLRTDDAWQKKFVDHDRELRFWVQRS